MIIDESGIAAKVLAGLDAATRGGPHRENN
jgi:hypothetical protein